MKINPEEFFAELEATGEAIVRNTLATEGTYGSDKRSLVVEWLRRKDQEHSDAFNREQISIARAAADAARDSADAARDAADAARDAADEAKQASMIAKIAIAVTVFVAVASIIS